MSLLYDDRPIPNRIRTKIGMPLISIEGGQIDPLDQPGGYRYEIPAGDRRILEQAIDDANSSIGDLVRQEIARSAILTALRAVGPFGPLLAFGGERLMNWLGFGIRVSMSQADVSKYMWGVNSAYQYQKKQLEAQITSLRYSVAGDIATYTIKYTRNYLHGGSYSDYGSLEADGGRIRIVYTQDLSIGALVQDRYVYSKPEGGPSVRELFESQAVPPDFQREMEYTGTFSITNKQPWWCLRWVIEDQDGANGWVNRREFPANCLPLTDGATWDFDDLLSLEDIGLDPSSLDPKLSDIAPQDLKDLIGNLKETPWYDKYFEPPDVGGVHPANPGWPCLPEGPQNPIPDNPPRLVTGPGGSRFPRPPGFDAPFKPGDEYCVTVAGKKQCGKIRRVPPPPGDIVVENPPYKDEYFTKAWCPKKGTLIITLIKKLAKELGVQNIGLVDADCKKKWPGGCFDKGASKFDAMWKLADMCGYGIFPRPPGGMEIGPIRPLPPDPRTYGPYHEHRDLSVFEPILDDLEIPSHVEVSRPHYRGSRGYSVVIEVRSPYSLKDKWFSMVAPRGTSEADAMDLAAQKARQFEMLTKMTDYAIPYNEFVVQRHPMLIQVPSEGYEGRFMVWEFVHDIDQGEGALTRIRGIELSRKRFAPRFEGYDVAWANSGIMT